MKKFIIYICLIVSTFFATSCDFLDFSNQQITTTDNPIVEEINNSISDVVDMVEHACVGIYAGTSNSTAVSIGSGVVYKKEGLKYYVITNYHVIEDTTYVKVYINRRFSITARVEATLPSKDLACLSFEAADKFDIKTVTIDNTIIPNPGETVIAIGCPLGLDNFNSVSVGVVSRTISEYEVDSNSTIMSIQHDASINSGNSGGGLFNMNGDLIGINYLKLTTTGETVVEGLGYAIYLGEVIDFLSQNNLL